jgi:threonine/homoserine/homoserine lactone efflux protein
VLTHFEWNDPGWRPAVIGYITRMQHLIFWQGMILGFVLCAPLGPIGILCIQRAITDGRLAGALSVLGAAVVDACYSLVAGLGLTMVAGLLDQGRLWIQPFSGLVLSAVGVRVYFGLPGKSSGLRGPVKNRIDAFLSTFFVMLSNPLPILVISAALSTINGSDVGLPPVGILFFVAGVFAGSAFWAPILVVGASLLKPMLQAEHMQILMRVCGAALCTCGVAVGIAPFIAD